MVLWRSAAAGEVRYSSAAFSRDQTTLYVGSNDNSLHALSRANGAEIFKYQTGLYL